MDNGEKEPSSGGRDDRWLEQLRHSDRRRSPLGSAEVVRRLFKGLSEKVPGWEMMTIINRWSEIVGDHQRAKLSQPVGLLEDGTLLIATENYMVRTELHFARKELLQRANRAIGRWMVRRIAFDAHKQRRL